ncbi:TfuA-like protein [Microvirga sp. 17 mud 1-3]|uniref:TfuA-like protein n=1 Tax=Microvirga sp. 17 mud 1-3 TaxID=2082949 RepID=UPI000D6B736A|nr:TfuA-like protein [Microvirga sp. 17 mud 1-3]AWM88651.1 tfuA protein [Microvirga sp. 17 mud 1-3]
MSVIVFAGPSLTARDRAAYPGLTFRPPAACGDIAKAVREGAEGAIPVAIGLIDGLFETAPSPWHKEILWALSRGIAVYGAASMGALRAAELHAFGMSGIGRIFAAYRDGLLDGDDEVAVQHGPAELGHIPLTEALVNIRATLARAQARSLIGPPEASRLIALARGLFYKDRTWEAVLTAGRQDGLNATALRRLALWLPVGKADLKRRDALGLVRTLSQGQDSLGEVRPFAFPRTIYWQNLLDRIVWEAEASKTDPHPGGCPRAPNRLLESLGRTPQSTRSSAG